MLDRREVVLVPGVYDPLTALIVQSLGFKVCYVGGWITGAHLATTEPLTTLTEMVANAASVVKAIKIPVIADADAGFGDALHTMRCVREFEFAGVSAIHIEDQVFPKRAHYHKGIEHVVPLEEFLNKIRAALEARSDPDFIIIARTDARQAVGGSLKEAIKRCQACVEAGVDVIMTTMSDREELKILRREVPDVPMVGGWSRKAAEEIGSQIVLQPLASVIAAAGGVIDIYKQFMETGRIISTTRWEEIRLKIEELIGLPDYYKIEETTVEKEYER